MSNAPDLTTVAGTKTRLALCMSEEHWGMAVDEFKEANGGYPPWWWAEIVQSGFADKVAKGWGGDMGITISAL